MEVDTLKKRCFWDSHGLSPEALEESEKADEESKNLKRITRGLI